MLSSALLPTASLPHDLETAKVALRLDYIRSAASTPPGERMTWRAAASKQHLNIADNIMSDGSAVSIGSQTAITAKKALKDSGLTERLPLQKFFVVVFELMADKDRALSAAVLEHCPAVSEKEIRSALELYMDSTQLPIIERTEKPLARKDQRPGPLPPIPILSGESFSASVSTDPPSSNTPESLTPTSSIVVRPRGDSIDYSLCENKNICRRLDARFALQHSTPVERETMKVQILGSRRPQLQARVILEELKIRPDQIWCVEKSDDATSDCEAGCREVGIHFVHQDLNEFLPVFMAMPGAKYCSIDWCQPWGNESTAALEKVAKSSNPLILSTWNSARREQLAFRDQQVFMGDLFRKVQGDKRELSADASSSDRCSFAKNSLNKNINLIREYVRDLAHGEGNASRRILDQGVTHKEMRRDSYLYNTILSTMFDNVLVGEQLIGSGMFSFGLAVGEKLRRHLLRHAKVDQMSESAGTMIGIALMFASCRSWVSDAQRWDYVSNTGTPMNVAFCKLSPVTQCLQNGQGVLNQLRIIGQSIREYGSAAHNCSIERSQEKKMLLRNLVAATGYAEPKFVFYRGPIRIASFTYGNLVSFMRSVAPYHTQAASEHEVTTINWRNLDSRVTDILGVSPL
jgi:hypothetical protein